MNTLGSAQRDTAAFEDLEVAPPAPSTHAALKLQVAERLAAHRSRRPRFQSQPSVPANAASETDTRAARIAAAVAGRYAHATSYRAFLAAEAELAIRHAEAAAEVAARTARAVVAAQQQLLDDLKLWPEPEPHDPPAFAAPAITLPQPPQALALVELDLAPVPAPTAPPPAQTPTGLTVRLEKTGPIVTGPLASLDSTRALRAAERSAASTNAEAPVLNLLEALALDAEIAFRHTPIFEEPAGPAIALPANLIEFPRQLVAPRKARPRIAEGPLREESEPAPGNGQLRIFEVEPDQISITPTTASAPTSATPEWNSILLGAMEKATPEPDSKLATDIFSDHFSFAPRPDTAPITHRLMAASVDATLVLTALLACATTFALTAGPATAAITPPTVASLTLAALGFLYLAYQLLFFSLSTATPGMRYAGIALCTFADGNPTRAAMRRRVFAILLSACPLGLGLLWSCLDEDRLSWHDRISHVYQRSY